PRGEGRGRDAEPGEDPRGRTALDARLRAWPGGGLVVGADERRARRARGLLRQRRARAFEKGRKPPCLRPDGASLPGGTSGARGAAPRAAAAQAAVALPRARPAGQERLGRAVARHWEGEARPCSAGTSVADRAPG